MVLWSAIAAALLLWAPQVLGQSTCPILGCATGQCTTLTVDLTQNWASKGTILSGLDGAGHGLEAALAGLALGAGSSFAAGLVGDGDGQHP